jgi:hypothetical protein
MVMAYFKAVRKIVEKPPQNLAGYFGGGQGLSWTVEPRKEEEEEEEEEEGTEENHENPQVRVFSGQESKPLPPEYEGVMIITRRSMLLLLLLLLLLMMMMIIIIIIIIIIIDSWFM